MQKPGLMEIGRVPLLGTIQDLPSQQRGEGAPGTGFPAFPVPKIQHPEPHRVLVWVLGHCPRSKRCRWPKGWQGSAVKPPWLCQGNCHLEQTDWFILGKPVSRALGWDQSAWAGSSSLILPAALEGLFGEENADA